MIYDDGYAFIGEILRALLGMFQIIFCLFSKILIANFCFVAEMGHFSYVALDRINKQRARKEVQWRKRTGQQIAGDEDKNDGTLNDYQSGAYWTVIFTSFLCINAFLNIKTMNVTFFVFTLSLILILSG